jgi:hypothetical protein
LERSKRAGFRRWKKTTHLYKTAISSSLEPVAAKMKASGFIKCSGVLAPGGVFGVLTRLVHL